MNEAGKDFLAFFMYCLREGLNPYAVTVLCFFHVYVIFRRFVMSRALLFGGLFVLSRFLTRSSLDLWFALGPGDAQILGGFAEVAHFFLGLLALSFGLVNGYDWWMCRVTLRPGKSVLKFKDRVQTRWYGKTFFGRAWPVITGIVFGVASGLLEATYSGKFYIDYLVDYLAGSDMTLAAARLVFIYHGIYLLPFIGTFVMTLALLSKPAFRRWVIEEIVLIKAAVAGVFIGLGSSLLHIFYLLYRS